MMVLANKQSKQINIFNQVPMLYELSIKQNKALIGEKCGMKVYNDFSLILFNQKLFRSFETAS